MCQAPPVKKNSRKHLFQIAAVKDEGDSTREHSLNPKIRTTEDLSGIQNMLSNQSPGKPSTNQTSSQPGSKLFQEKSPFSNQSDFYNSQEAMNEYTPTGMKESPHANYFQE